MEETQQLDVFRPDNSGHTIIGFRDLVDPDGNPVDLRTVLRQGFPPDARFVTSDLRPAQAATARISSVGASLAAPPKARQMSPFPKATGAITSAVGHGLHVSKTPILALLLMRSVPSSTWPS